MIQLLHNPRCTKSREAKQYLDDKGLQYELREYLKEPLKEEDLKSILTKLGLKPIDLIRTNEAEWKELYKGKDLSDAELIKAMIKHPKLMQRPIVIKDDKAVVARPKEEIDDIL